MLAAAVVAVNIHHAMKMNALFPALRTCKVVSSDFEERDDEGNTFWRDGGSDLEGLSHGPLSELVVHDVLKSTTTIMPFRAPRVRRGDHLRRMRDTTMHAWRNEEDELFIGPLTTIEAVIERPGFIGESDTTVPSKPKSKARDMSERAALKEVSDEVYGRYHTEVYPGLLDRTEIREKRIEDGTAERRYSTL